MAQGFGVSHFLNMVNKDAKRSMSHGLDQRLLALQAEAIGIPIVQKATSWEEYEQDFKNTIIELKKLGVESMVFGDIDLQEHKDWIERVCAELDIKPIMPLWGLAPERILNEFIDVGFEAIIVSAKSDYFGAEWLGRRIDRELVRELQELKMNIHLCGELGEYHTFVTDGPLFKKRVKILDSRKVLRDNYWFLDILSWRLEAKQRFISSNRG